MLCKLEVRLEEFGQTQGGARLLNSDGILVAVIPKPVGCAGGDGDPLSRADTLVAPSDDETKGARHDLGGGYLVRMDVHGLRYGAWGVKRLDPQQLSVGVGGCEQKSHPLAGARVEDLACVRHSPVPIVEFASVT